MHYIGNRVAFVAECDEARPLNISGEIREGVGPEMGMLESGTSCLPHLCQDYHREETVFLLVCVFSLSLYISLPPRLSV